jgi:hypothetical protein
MITAYGIGFSPFEKYGSERVAVMGVVYCNRFLFEENGAGMAEKGNTLYWFIVINKQRRFKR